MTITVLNLGPHRAENVSIEVMGTAPPMPHNFVNMVHDATIDGGDQRVCGLQLPARFTPPPRLLLTWVDGRDGVQRYQRTLQLSDGLGPAFDADMPEVEQGTWDQHTGDITWDK